MTPVRKYGYTWATLALFLLSLWGHWALAWSSYVTEQEAHGRPAEVADYVVQTGRDTLENWQSEFLQLVWQVAGLAFLLHVGSGQSKEGDQRREEKLDAILGKLLSSEERGRLLSSLESRYPKS